ncbi:DUF192 domain-containing protein [Maribacter sp. ACAM166]|uniref:DUF192 domain-containing protein n=1 Tax=Maribacter sp. ACAM166 TaxID=2508996 RepID=UPI0010FF02AC|nr:DUF192 domain-containing protein [Maribacter sp. ACAM166]TLP77032.1 DUF192 domain-containing protein [Maribacter sp. ACAM166]
MFNFRSKYWVLIVVLTVLLTSCQEDAKKTITTQQVDFTYEGDLSIFKKTSDTLRTKFNIEFAQTEYETQTGLMYRKGMAKNQAMLFIFPEEAVHSFYMKNTEFSLDILYIDKDLKIASTQENAQPLNEGGLSSLVAVKYVLEINGGLTEELGIKVGDSISFTKN